MLLNEVTELVHFSYILCSDSPPVAVEAKWRQFENKGVVTTDMLEDDRFSAHYIPEFLSPVELIKHFQYLLISAPLSSRKYYFMSFANDATYRG